MYLQRNKFVSIIVAALSYLICSPLSAKTKAKDDVSYTKCRNKVLTEVKDGRLAQDAVRPALDQCLARFPSAAVYIDCKSQVLKRYADAPEQASEKLKECQNFRVMAEQSPDDPFPLNVLGRRVFYFGADLRTSIPFGLNTKVPYLNCDKLNAVLNGSASPEFLLYGNSLASFPAFAGRKTKELFKTVGTTRGADEDGPYLEMAKLGRIYGITEKNPTLYFPSASCRILSGESSLFREHRIYFLIDRSNSMLIPYFAISFYLESQEEFSLKELVADALRTLGPPYKTRKLRKDVLFISKDEPTSYDFHNDPKDFCLNPRKESLVAALRLNDAKKPNALVVANLENACTFGDAVAAAAVLK